jgi:hypothetical protein
VNCATIRGRCDVFVAFDTPLSPPRRFEHAVSIKSATRTTLFDSDVLVPFTISYLCLLVRRNNDESLSFAPHSPPVPCANDIPLLVSNYHTSLTLSLFVRFTSVPHLTMSNHPLPGVHHCVHLRQSHESALMLCRSKIELH